MAVDDTLLLIAPEMSAVSSADRAGVAALAALSVSSDVFGDQEELATAYLAAHMLTIRGRAGNSGAVKGLKEGDLSITYGSDSNGMNGEYSATSYGQEFLRIRKGVIFTARTRVV